MIFAAQPSETLGRAGILHVMNCSNSLNQFDLWPRKTIGRQSGIFDVLDGFSLHLILGHHNLGERVEMDGRKMLVVSFRSRLLQEIILL